MRNVSDVDYSARFHWLLRRFHNGREGLNVRNAQIRLTHILILPARTHTQTHIYLRTLWRQTHSVTSVAQILEQNSQAGLSFDCLLCLPGMAWQGLGVGAVAVVRASVRVGAERLKPLKNSICKRQPH